MHFFIGAGKVEAGIGVTLNRSGPKFLGPEKLGPERLGPERQAIQFWARRALVCQHDVPFSDPRT